jgi:acyl-CoA thioesterase
MTRRISYGVTVPPKFAACEIINNSSAGDLCRGLRSLGAFGKQGGLHAVSQPGAACADYLLEQDAALRSLGLERLSIKAGQATVAMTVLTAMVNGIGITHGGAIFTLADSAFSLASNAYNERTVCAHCSISYLRPTKLGDRLVATATEVVRSGRSGIYDVSVTLEDTAIAEFRAHSRVIGGALLPTAAVSKVRPTATPELEP